MTNLDLALVGRVRYPSDRRLLVACREGDEEAWSALVDRYRNLIFSVPIKFGLCRDDAADIFQAVCVDLLAELPRLRDPEALPKWLLRVAAHKCIRWKQRLARDGGAPDASATEALPASESAVPEAMLHAVERDQALRVAIAGLPPRCRRMIEMLFFEQPPRSYRHVATELGLAAGSIGFIRMRCLERLRTSLARAGF